MAGKTISIRYGKLKLVSGDVVPLVKEVPIIDGGFTYTITKNVTPILNRGKLYEARRGDDAPITWSFTSKFEDLSLQRTLDEFIWDGQVQLITGLTAAALNDPVPLAYDFLAGSFQVTDGAPFAKLVAGSTPATDGEYAEDDIGTTVDREGVAAVPGATGVAIFMPTGDTDVNVSYDAVGKSTRDAELGQCQDDIKTLDIVIEVYDPCNPTVLLNTYTIKHAYLTTGTFTEADPNDTLAFSGSAFSTRVIES